MVEKNKGGRPSGYSIETAERICKEIAAGHSLESICKRDDFPGSTAVYKWLTEHDEFADKYARARDQQADKYFDDIVSIADNCLATPEEIQKARLRVDARKWTASKLAPKKYGDKLEHSGKVDGDLNVKVVQYSKKDCDS